MPEPEPERNAAAPDPPTPHAAPPPAPNAAPPDVEAGFGGRRADVERFLAVEQALGRAVGRVTVVSRGFDTVRLLDGTDVLTDRSTAAFRSAGLDGPPAVGDWVAVGRDGSAQAIVAVAPRSGVIVRRDPAERAVAQVVASNIDTVFCVFGLDRELRPRRVERVLVLVHEGGAAPVVVLTKSDLDVDSTANPVVAAVEAVAGDVPIHIVSSATGAGLDDLVPYLAAGRTVALLGESGAGKSSLVNALTQRDATEVGEVRSRDHRGRHTTTARRLFTLPGGAALIDTPGLRSLGLWDAAEGVDEAFADVAAIAAQCRFRDCRHLDEPGCAVRRAVSSGTLRQARLDAYRNLRQEIVTIDARKEAGRRLRGEGRRPALRRARRRASVDADEDDAGPDDGPDA